MGLMSDKCYVDAKYYIAKHQCRGWCVGARIKGLLVCFYCLCLFILQTPVVREVMSWGTDLCGEETATGVADCKDSCL